MDAEVLTLHALRADLALQLARALRARGLSQSQAARELGVPQPTLSLIHRGKVDSLSIELLIRIAVRLGLPLVLQTGVEPSEAGVFRILPGRTMPKKLAQHSQSTRVGFSRLADAARLEALEAARSLTTTQRLQKFLDHNRQVAALRRAAGRP